LEIPPSLNSKRAACFSSSASISLGAEISTPARILLCLIFSGRKDFTIRLIFLGRKDFTIRLIFSNRKDFPIRLIFTGRMYLYIFPVFYFSAFFIKYAPIFDWRNCFRP
jgi:hypothetical protein